MRIDAKTNDPNLLQVINGLISNGAVIDVLTSDLSVFALSGLRLPTAIYRYDLESLDHVWLQCPIIDAAAFDLAMDTYNAHWATMINQPHWKDWIAVHPIPSDVLAA